MALSIASRAYVTGNGKDYPHRRRPGTAGRPPCAGGLPRLLRQGIGEGARSRILTNAGQAPPPNSYFPPTPPRPLREKAKLMVRSLAPSSVAEANTPALTGVMETQGIAQVAIVKFIASEDIGQAERFCNQDLNERFTSSRRSRV